MENFKGTQGRWIIYNESEKRHLGHNYGIMNNGIFDVPQKDICSVWHDKETGPEAIYNAKLISKAPELLAKLQYLCEMDILKEHEQSVLKLIKEATEL